MIKIVYIYYKKQKIKKLKLKFKGEIYMADNKKWDRSDSFIYTWRNSEGKKEYYAGQLIFCNKTMLKEWDMEEEQTGYYAMMVNCKYDKITGKPYDANMLFSDLKLLVACGRRSQKNYELSMEKFSETVYTSIEIMEKDRELMRTLGETDDEIENIKKKIREEYENEKMEKEDNKIPMLRAEPLEKKDKEEEKNDNKVYLKDIAGLKEVKEEVMEIVDAFKNKEKYEKFGIKMNLNILLSGSPGCGKTMLGKAIANECGATFYYECGSNFMNKYVGVGASKVRELYDNARKNAPSVIFIDECECVMGKRSSDENSGKEAAQTLNQILVELDGMNTTDDVITICATNRPDILDEAVLRAGRLSRKIEVPILDIEGRRELIKLYAETKPLNEDVDLEEIARMSSGMSGAELFNLINEAAIYAVRGDQDDITMKNFKDAYEKITTGLKSQTKRLSDKEKRVTAVHELSHALCGLLLGSERKISKLSILPRNNNTLGFVLYQHDDIEDKYIYTKEELENRIKVSLAGKIGEKIVFNHYSSGCQGDLDNVSNIAYNMVTRYGMSNLGSSNMDKDNLFLQEKIHEEMNAIVGKCYKECKALLKDNLDILNSLVDYVIQEEEITGEEFEKVYNDALERRKEINN